MSELKDAMEKLARATVLRSAALSIVNGVVPNMAELEALEYFTRRAIKWRWESRGVSVGRGPALPSISEA